MAASFAKCAIMARTKVVLPAPRSPESAMKSPGSSMLATSTANRRVASSFASTTVDPWGPQEYVCIVIRHDLPRLFGRVPRHLGHEREGAYHGRSLSWNGIYPDGAAVELHEGAHDRQPKAGAAMMRAVGVGFE